MDVCSQHTLQTMEPAGEFDLNRGLQSWREQLAVQSGLTPETRQELESHLRETMTDLRRQGLNTEEAFWLARRRLGPPEQLGQEFAKDNPVSRRWALWVATAMLGVWIIQGALAGVSGVLTLIELKTAPLPYTEAVRMPWSGGPHGHPFPPLSNTKLAAKFTAKLTAVEPFWLEGIRDAFWNESVRNVLGALMVICVAAWVTCQPERTSARLWRLVFGSRGRFLLIGVLSIFVISMVESGSERVIKTWLMRDEFSYFNSRSDFELMVPVVLVLLITGLIPSGKRQLRQTSAVSPISP